MRTQLMGSWLLGLALAPVLAGQNRWLPPRCNLKPGHYLVNSAVLYLKNSVETRFEEQKEKDLRDAERTLDQALTRGGQEKNPAAWYYLGRYYVLRQDGLGADSAFRRAEALEPQCQLDIQLYRRNYLWLPAYNAGVAALNAQQYDSALAAFRLAAAVYDGEPQTFSVLATTYFNLPQETFLPESTFRAAHPGLPDSVATVLYDSLSRTRYDSAAKYFRKAVTTATEPKDSIVKRDGMFNLGNAFYAGRDYDSAAAAYSQYLAVVPNDPQALARLGDVLSQAGHEDSAMGVYRTIIAHADSVEPTSLFSAGVSIYNSAPPRPDSAKVVTNCRRDSTGGATVARARRQAITAACTAVAVKAAQDRDSAAQGLYQLASRAFEAGLARAPRSRDGLYNLANAYFALQEPDKMLGVAQRLVAIDPLNRTALRLVAQAFQLKRQSDSALHYVTLADSLIPVEVSISRFVPEDQKASLGGLVTNYHDKQSAPLTLVFEFLDEQGNAVATQAEEVPAIPAGGSHAFQVQAMGSGIVAWRYKQQ